MPSPLAGALDIAYPKGASRDVDPPQTQRRSDVRAVLTTLMIASLTGPALAKPPLRDVPAIDDALLSVGLAHTIRKECDQISARKVKAMLFLMDLQKQARDLGYSPEEIKAYHDSDAEKDRMRARGAQWLRARGETPGPGVDWCRIGREEIDKGSQIGSFLKVN